jgi:hypothetical protein
MWITGEFLKSAEKFSPGGPRTLHYLNYTIHDLGEKQWNGIFGALASFLKRAEKEHARKNCKPEPCERIRLPDSDPPSPTRDY